MTSKGTVVKQKRRTEDVLEEGEMQSLACVSAVCNISVVLHRHGRDSGLSAPRLARQGVLAAKVRGPRVSAMHGSLIVGCALPFCRYMLHSILWAPVKHLIVWLGACLVEAYSCLSMRGRQNIHHDRGLTSHDHILSTVMFTKPVRLEQ